MSAGEYPWVILVGGEHHGVVAPNGVLGAHSSIEYIGQAFASLRGLGIPRDRIHVIAQAKETLDWLEAAGESGIPLFSPSLSPSESSARWRSRHDHLAASLSLLMQEGGADVDGQDVHSGSVLSALATAAQRDDSAPIFVAIYSHGWSHEVCDPKDPHYRLLCSQVPCDLCGNLHLIHSDDDDDGSPPVKQAVKYDHDPSSLSHREFYFHLPYPHPPTPDRDAAYGSCSYSHMKNPFTRMYVQMLTKAFAAAVEHDPGRDIVCLANWCGSGGTAKFLTQRSYLDHMGVDSWPLYLMMSSGEQESSLSTFWSLWFSQLASLGAQNKLHSTTLNDLFVNVETAYKDAHPELLTQSISVETPCLICKDFQGRDPHTLCSVCEKEFTSNPDAYDLDALAVAALESHDPNPNSLVFQEQDSYLQRPRTSQGDPSMEHRSLASIFRPSGRDATKTG